MNKLNFKNPFVQQYILELLLPIIGYFFFNWTLPIIAVFYLMDQLGALFSLVRKLKLTSNYSQVSYARQMILSIVASLISFVSNINCRAARK